MPTFSVDQYASTSSFPSRVVYPLARPQSQSMTALGASDSFSPPTVGTPSERPVPGEVEWTTIKPRGTQVEISESEITGRRSFSFIFIPGGRSEEHTSELQSRGHL